MENALGMLDRERLGSEVMHRMSTIQQRIDSAKVSLAEPSRLGTVVASQDALRFCVLLHLRRSRIVMIVGRSLSAE